MRSPSFRSRHLAVMVVCLFVASMMFGCSGDTGPSGPTTGTITGTVLTSTGAPIQGVTVGVYSNSKLSKVTDSAERYTLSRAIVAGETPVATTTTGSDGKYTLANLAPGSYTITFTNPSYTIGSIEVSLIAGASLTVNAGMGSSIAVAASPAGSPTVTLKASDDEVGFGNTVNLTATATSPVPGVTLTYTWTGATASSGDPTTATVTMKSLAAALGGATTAGDPGGYTSAYVQENRFGILPMTPDTRGAASPSVKVSDGQGGSTTASVALNATGVQTGLANVSVGIPVYMNSGHDGANSWTLTTKPSGSTATLKDATTRNAWFKPDLAGSYTLTEGTNSMIVYAGKYVGAIDGGSSTTRTISGSEVGMWAGAAGTYTNWPVVKPADNCTVCHSIPAIAPDMFTPWAKTAHATFFSRGLENITSNSNACLTCHTVGYDTAPSAANNDGFFAQMIKENFIYKKATGAWPAMWKTAPQTARVSNIQCENCHGPQSDAHKTGKTTRVRISLSAELCATCHASGTGHHIYSEWLKLDPDTGYGHSKLSTAIAESASGSCARCHTAEGYLVYLDKLAAGNIGSLAASDLANWNANTVHAVTCSACHDPHDDTNPNQLRVFDSTPLLPAGFKVAGLGKGALCATCHNSRNAAQAGSTTMTYLHEDGETYNSGNPTGFSAPHQACQTDVFMGRNAYFMGTSLPQVSKHASVEDSCAGCHIALNPQTHLSHGSPAVSGHVMYIRDQDKAALCANCHSDNTTGEGLVAGIESQMATLSAKLAASVKNKLAAATVSAPLYLTIYPTDDQGAILADAKGGEVSTAKAALMLDGSNPVVSVVMEEVHGQIGAFVTLTNPVTMSITTANGTANYTFRKFEVQAGAIFNKATPASSPADTDTVYKLNGNFVRAGWNFYLIEGDSSKGVHNPTFAQAVLNASIGKDLSN